MASRRQFDQAPARHQISRRQFLRKTGYAGLAVGASTFLPWRFVVRDAYAYSSSPTLAKFVEALRDVTAGGIPVAASDGTGLGGAMHYSLTLEEFQDLLHPSLPNPTRLWGYRPSNVPNGLNKHLGGIIVANRGTAVQITATNELPSTHILPVDRTIPGAELADNRATIHLHGGLVPWNSDGGPHSWFAPNGGGYGVSAGAGGASYKAVNPGLLPGQAEYYYPNNQGARAGLVSRSRDRHHPPQCLCGARERVRDHG